MLTHGNYRAILDMVGEAGEIQGDEIDLPLPAARALLRAADPARRRSTSARTLAYFGGDTKQIIGELQEVKPTYLPSVPRIFEKIYTLAQGAIRPSRRRSRPRPRPRSSSA